MGFCAGLVVLFPSRRRQPFTGPPNKLVTGPPDEYVSTPVVEECRANERTLRDRPCAAAAAPSESVKLLSAKIELARMAYETTSSFTKYHRPVTCVFQKKSAVSCVRQLREQNGDARVGEDRERLGSLRTLNSNIFHFVSKMMNTTLCIGI